jgi:HD-like signal output (HDOD) protein
MDNKDLKAFIEKIPTIPTMPMIIVEALELIKDPSSNVAKLSNVVSKDISITTEVLKLVNSAYYGFPYQITTINKAIALLGLKKIKSLLMSIAVKQIMTSSSGKQLWEHSIKCAVGSQLVASSLGYDNTEEFFTMGLLHDVGKTVMELYDRAVFNEINQLVEVGADRLVTEKMLVGFDHSEIGEELLLRWNLPAMISSCVRYHHNPRLSDEFSRVGIVYIVDRIIQPVLPYPVFDSAIMDEFDFEISDHLALREEILEKSQAIIGTLS